MHGDRFLIILSAEQIAKADNKIKDLKLILPHTWSDQVIYWKSLCRGKRGTHLAKFTQVEVKKDKPFVISSNQR